MDYWIDGSLDEWIDGIPSPPIHHFNNPITQPSIKKRRGLSGRRSGFLPFSSQEKGLGDEFRWHQDLFA